MKILPLAYNIKLNYNNSSDNKYRYNKTLQYDTFESSRKCSFKASIQMEEDLKLTKKTKEALSSSNREDTYKYLENFSDITALILRSYPKDDIINTVQAFIDAAGKETDPKFLEKYMSILYMAICPNTGVGQYIDEQPLQNNEIISQKFNDILNYIVDSSQK